MTFGKKRRKKKKKVAGFVGLNERREKKAELLEVQQKEFEKFRTRHPKLAKALEEIRSDAAEGYQIPKTDYNVGDHLRDVYELVLQMGDERKKVLAELDEIFSRKSNSTRYLALMKAASVPGFNEKALSKSAQRIKTAVKIRVPLDDFEDYRKGVDKQKAASLGRKK